MPPLTSKTSPERQERPQFPQTHQVVADPVPEDVELHQSQFPIPIFLGEG